MVLPAGVGGKPLHLAGGLRSAAALGGRGAARDGEVPEALGGGDVGGVASERVRERGRRDEDARGEGGGAEDGEGDDARHEGQGGAGLLIDANGRRLGTPSGGTASPRRG